MNNTVEKMRKAHHSQALVESARGTTQSVVSRIEYGGTYPSIHSSGTPRIAV